MTDMMFNFKQNLVVEMCKLLCNFKHEDESQTKSILSSYTCIKSNAWTARMHYMKKHYKHESHGTLAFF